MQKLLLQRDWYDDDDGGGGGGDGDGDDDDDDDITGYQWLLMVINGWLIDDDDGDGVPSAQHFWH